MILKAGGLVPDQLETFVSEVNQNRLLFRYRITVALFVLHGPVMMPHRNKQMHTYTHTHTHYLLGRVDLY